VRLAFASLLLLAACGAPIPRDAVTVRTYTDANGDVVPPTGNLGFTYGPVGEGGSKHGEAGFNVLVNPVLANDPDDDRLTRVVLHELGNVLVLDDGAFPPEMDGAWFLWDGDGQVPFHSIGPDEAAWFARHAKPYRVTVKDDWLRQATAEAILRITLAAGVEVFR